MNPKRKFRDFMLGEKTKLISVLFCLITVDVNADILYEFTNSGRTGPFGPSQSQVDAAYLGTTLESQVTVNGGIQLWTVPQSGIYTI